MMKSMKYLILLLLVLSALLIACEEVKVDVVPQPPPLEERQEVERKAPEPEVAPEEQEIPAPQSAKDELDALLAAAPEQSFVITYLNTASFNGTDTDSETTQYVDGEKFRVDIIESVDGKKVEFRRFANGAFAECFREDGDEWHCIKYPESDGAVQEQQDVEEPETLVTRLPGRVIAGEPTKCYEVKIITESITQEACYSDDAIVLFFRAEGPDGYTQTTATEFSTTIPADAFVLPAEPELLTLE